MGVKDLFFPGEYVILLVAHSLIPIEKMKPIAWQFLKLSPENWFTYF